MILSLADPPFTTCFHYGHCFHFPSFITLLRTIKFEYKEKSFPFQSPRHKRVAEAWRYSALCLKTVTKKFSKQIICSWTFVDLFGAVGNGPSMELLNFSHSVAGISMERSPNYSRGYFQIQIRHRKFGLFSHANGDVFGMARHRCVLRYSFDGPLASDLSCYGLRMLQVSEADRAKFQCQAFEHVNVELSELVPSSHSIIRGEGDDKAGEFTF